MKSWTALSISCRYFPLSKLATYTIFGKKLWKIHLQEDTYCHLKYNFYKMSKEKYTFSCIWKKLQVNLTLSVAQVQVSIVN